jgi:hypothetical protein
MMEPDPDPWVGKTLKKKSIWTAMLVTLTTPSATFSYTEILFFSSSVTEKACSTLKRERIRMRVPIKKCLEFFLGIIYIPPIFVTQGFNPEESALKPACRRQGLSYRIIIIGNSGL